MTFSDETLMAYADGELDAATRAAVESAAAADPQLAQRIARHRALRARLQGAFEPLLAQPVPERLLAVARGTGGERRGDNVIAFGARRPPRWSWPQWGAMAASLIVGVLLGPLLLRSGAPRAPLDVSGGRVLASGALAHALSQQLASGQPAAAPVSIGISFRARRGGYCRTFVLHQEQSLAGLACREGSSWQVMALAQSAASPGGYRQAASALPPAVAGTLDELMEGDPLDAASEAAARAHGWNP
ncbi:MAG TPA: anti-sigma factor [Candidatus Dormibacteraeota bacterium]|nr:anti-sigma factor [Candidatus Dormibacteraeota bacterium]